MRFKQNLILTMIVMLLTLGMLSVPTIGKAATTNYSEVITGIQIVPLTFSRVITATATPITFRIPFSAEVLGVSAHAKVLDTVDGDESYKVDIKEAGTSILSTPLVLAAQDTIYEAVVSDTSIADEATMTVVVTIAGTTPSLTDLTVILTLRRTN